MDEDGKAPGPLCKTLNDYVLDMRRIESPTFNTRKSTHFHEISCAKGVVDFTFIVQTFKNDTGGSKDSSRSTWHIVQMCDLIHQSDARATFISLGTTHLWAEAAPCLQAFSRHPLEFKAFHRSSVDAKNQCSVEHAKGLERKEETPKPLTPFSTAFTPYRSQ